ncbi:M23 family metallopeptidase [Paenibacillaceae bacterium WGS1546]|uniref:M23 family metallopeptidase n=1 Tax=Cohnella sp. WGS1546 TaxID=3366810 RepID=UPI00372D3039
MRRLMLLMACSAIWLSGCGGNGNDGGAAPSEAVGTDAPGAKESASPANGERGERMSAEKIVQSLLDGKYDEVYGLTSEAFRQEIAPGPFLEAVTAFGEGVTEWKPNTSMALNGGEYSTWTDQDGNRGLLLFMDGEGTITGIQFVPLERYPETDDRPTGLAYAAPFRGEWLVFWGGQDVLANYHYEHPSQRYAYDFVQAKDGFSYSGDATLNESYYAFGQEALAPQDGTVALVVNDIPDNAPVGTVNPDEPAGNLVVLDHGNGEYSFLAHLKEGSVRVKAGDRVNKGDPVGLIGNSGNSSEPHLHFHIGDSSDLFSGTSIRVHWESGLDPLQGTMMIGK